MVLTDDVLVKLDRNMKPFAADVADVLTGPVRIVTRLVVLVE